MKGDIADVYRNILKDCCAPIYGVDRDTDGVKDLSEERCSQHAC